MQASIKTGIFFPLALMLTTFVKAQQLEVKRVELKGDEVIVHYALADSVAGRSYSVNLYSSLDTYVNPLTHVAGDFGSEVKPGAQRTITWNAKKELGEAFNDKVSIELRARVFIPFIRFDSFEKIKRGKLTEVTWRGGTPQNILNFELWRAGKRVEVIPNIPNAQHAKIEIPRNVKAGKNYTFKIVDSKNKDLAIQTAPFAIRPKVPWLIKVLPIVVVGGVVGFLAGGKSVSDDLSIVDPLGLPARN
jgi:hypothetical protein